MSRCYVLHADCYEVTSISFSQTSEGGIAAGTLFTTMYKELWLLMLLPFTKGVFSERWETKVLNSILEGYNTAARPLNDNNETVQVAVLLSLFQIRQLDMRNQMITQNIWMRMKWKDEYLRWNASEYGDVNQIRVGISDIWRPDVLLYNSVDEERSAVEVFAETVAQVSSEGVVEWATPALVTTSCKVDIRLFPFDEQICPLTFGSWTYHSRQLNISVWGEKGDGSNFIENGEWTLLDIPAKRVESTYPCCPGELYPTITYYVQIQRRPLFYNFNLIVPCIWLIIIAVLVFYLPPESGEKVSLAVTVLLAMTVFLLLVADNMPPTSDGIPILGQFFGATVILLSLSTGLTVVITNFHFSGEMGRRAPRLVRMIVLEWVAYILCMRSFTAPFTEKESLDEDGVQLTQVRDADKETPPSPTSSEPVLNSILDNVEKLRKEIITRNQDQDKGDRVKQEWQVIAIVMDRFFLLCYTIISIALILGIFFPPGGKDRELKY